MNEETMTTIQNFVAKHGITMESRPVGSNPYAQADEWAKNAHHYMCILRMGNREMPTPFSMGSALTEPPTAEDVINSLGLDASSIDAHKGDFESWASDYGYSTDSRKAEATFIACLNQAIKLEAFLGEDTYQELTSGDVEWL